MNKLINYIRKHPIEIAGLLILFFSCVLSLIAKNHWIFIASILYYAVGFVWEFGVYKSNRKKPLYIITPDKFNEPYHPSVLYFEIPWKGYSYWMAFSPMPKKGLNKPYIDRWECPCVYQSNGGVLFEDAFHLGFLDDLTPDEIENCDYFSDPHLVHNELNNTLELYYRLTHRNAKEGKEELLLLRKISADGCTWSEREVIANSINVGSPIGSVFVSPAIIRENGQYKMWFISSYGDNRIVSFVESSDMILFGDMKKCIFSGREVDPWHIDCKKIHDTYIMLVYEFTNELSLWESEDGAAFVFKKVLIKSSTICGQFYHGLYRACMTENELDGWNVYFSYKNSLGNGIGLAKGKTIEECEVCDGNGDYSFLLFFLDFLNKYCYAIVRLFSIGVR